MGPNKYVVLDLGDGPTIMIFPNFLDHNVFLELDYIILSAGYFNVRIKNGELSVTTSGESLTLGLSPQEGDNILIEQLINHRKFDFKKL